MAVSKFWREIDQRYNLKGVECGNCGQKMFPARSLCPKCRHLSYGKLKPFAFQGDGTVESFTVVHAPPPGFELSAPYVIALIRLAEGPVVTAQVVDVALDAVRIGLPVRRVFRRINQDGEGGIVHYGYKFGPVPGAEGAVEAARVPAVRDDPAQPAGGPRRGPGPAG